jgi:hypothetical protein
VHRDHKELKVIQVQLALQVLVDLVAYLDPVVQKVQQDHKVQQAILAHRDQVVLVAYLDLKV